MSDSQDSDEIQAISRRLETVTTMETNPRINLSDRTSMESKINDGTRVLPALNLPEKIILIIDVTKEPNCTDFKLGNGETYVPLFMIKRVVEIFVKGKSMFNQRHEFAIMTLCNDTMKWICEFTSNLKTVLDALETVVEEPIEEERLFDMGQLFEVLDVHVAPQPGLDFVKDIPSFVTRAILIYARSNCVPKFLTGRQYLEALYDDPTFFLDCLYVHEPPGEDNKCEEIYAELGSLDARNSSYIFEVGRNTTKLHDNMAKLLAHPLQRSLQKNASYSIALPARTVAVEETQTIV